MESTKKLCSVEMKRINEYLKEKCEEDKLLLLMHEFQGIEVSDIEISKSVTQIATNTIGYNLRLHLLYFDIDGKSGPFAVDTWIEHINHEEFTFANQKRTKPISNVFFYPGSSYLTTLLLGKFQVKEFANNSERHPTAEFIVEYLSKNGFLDWFRNTEIEETIALKLITKQSNL